MYCALRFLKFLIKNIKYCAQSAKPKLAISSSNLLISKAEKILMNISQFLGNQSIRLLSAKGVYLYPTGLKVVILNHLIPEQATQILQFAFIHRGPRIRFSSGII